ncbi:hypothetical protein GWC77_27455 [Paraburkholderia sp. NMBU_R16]|uniref:hypothetical protein n=1 Tax=Paraburkholderia sp. NMBU_R16 TaxID=2698676 RepID=UPI001564DF0E|nr:hypothetical protein [Paraburkholderia sp. NMBU_R16]NRO99597.1 hypothetical protein [Paraburkholderia sp. NMBU_R16]
MATKPAVAEPWVAETEALLVKPEIPGTPHWNPHWGKVEVYDPSVPQRLRIREPDLDKPLKSPELLHKYLDPNSLPEPTITLTKHGEFAKYGESFHVPINMQHDYEAARKYLASGPAGRELLATVENHELPVYVLTDERNDGIGYFSNPDDRGLVLRWDSTVGTATTAGGAMSPAEGLAHEMGHAIRFYPDASGGIFNNRPIRDNKIPSSDNADERNIIRSSDVKISAEHGKNHFRDDHNGVEYQVRNVTSTIAAHANDAQTINAFKDPLRHYTAEMDRRGIDPEWVSEKDLHLAAEQILNHESLPELTRMSDAQLVAMRQLLIEEMKANLDENAKQRGDGQLSSGPFAEQ